LVGLTKYSPKKLIALERTISHGAELTNQK